MSDNESTKPIEIIGEFPVEDLPNELKTVSFEMTYSGKEGETKKVFFLPEINLLLKEMFTILFHSQDLKTLQIRSEVEGSEVLFSFALDDNDVLTSSGSLNFARNNPLAYLQGFFNLVNGVLADYSKIGNSLGPSLDYDHELGAGSPKKFMN